MEPFVSNADNFSRQVRFKIITAVLVFANAYFRAPIVCKYFAEGLTEMEKLKLVLQKHAEAENRCLASLIRISDWVTAAVDRTNRRHHRPTRILSTSVASSGTKRPLSATVPDQEVDATPSAKDEPQQKRPIVATTTDNMVAAGTTEQCAVSATAEDRL